MNAQGCDQSDKCLVHWGPSVFAKLADSSDFRDSRSIPKKDLRYLIRFDPGHAVLGVFLGNKFLEAEDIFQVDYSHD